MESALTLVIPLTAGALLGLLYFGGLWQTLRRLPGSRHPWRLLAASYTVRLAVALGGFHLVMDGAWERMAAAMVGFLAVRAAMIRGLGPKDTPSPKGVPAWKS